ncbi:hypothetical protein ABZ412_05875 [Nocardia sp. NPDC005746]|uniref:hypothetical protein n=1 Tax=Nocardia sp. NPDC005746 TaxID=3157062 RepID=UPI0034060D2E
MTTGTAIASSEDAAARTAGQIDEAAELLDNGDVFAAEALIMATSPGDMTNAITVAAGAAENPRGRR